MNAAITTYVTKPILAIDLGKYKSVACVFRGDPRQARFASLTTDREHLRKLTQRTKPSIVLIEACLLAGWVHDPCEEMHVKCEVANIAQHARSPGVRKGSGEDVRTNGRRGVFRYMGRRGRFRPPPVGGNNKRLSSNSRVRPWATQRGGGECGGGNGDPQCDGSTWLTGG